MTASTTNPHTSRPDLATFFLRNREVVRLGNAIAKLQQREDLSGKFARKLAVQRRGVLDELERVEEQRVDMLKRVHAVKYPTGHEKAGEFTPVFATKPDGAPMYKLDDNGNETAERITIPEQYNLKDPQAYTNDYKEMMEEWTSITVPTFKVAELESFKQIRGDVMDALTLIEEGSEATTKPADWKEPRHGLELVKDVPLTAEADTAAGEPAPAAEPEVDRSAP